MTRLETELAAATDAQQRAEQQVTAGTEDRSRQLDARVKQTETLTRLEARLAALKQVQANVEANEKLDPWLRGQGLEGLPRLFRKLSVEAGWETAFEGVLRERVESVEVGRLDTVAGLATNAPPARVAFYSTSAAVVRDGGHIPGFGRLSDLVRGHDAALSAVLADWLANVFVATDLATALAARDQLPPGGQFVVKAGHLVSRYGVRFFAADDQKSGLLARRLEIENLDKEIRAQRLIVEEATGAVARAEAALRQAQESQQASRREVERLRTQLHSAADRSGPARRADRPREASQRADRRRAGRDRGERPRTAQSPRRRGQPFRAVRRRAGDAAGEGRERAPGVRGGGSGAACRS